MSVLAEFERDLLRERVRSGMAAAKSRGVTFERQVGFAPTQRRKGALILSKRNEGKGIRKIVSRVGDPHGDCAAGVEARQGVVDIAALDGSKKPDVYTKPPTAAACCRGVVACPYHQYDHELRARGLPPSRCAARAR